MKKINKDILKGIYDALGGIASEMGAEAFDAFYNGGGEKMFSDFERVLSEECGIQFVNPEYKAVPMTTKKGDGPNGEDYFYDGKWMIVDQTGAMVLTGLTSREDAERVIRDVCNAA